MNTKKLLTIKTDKSISYNPSPYLKRVIEESEREYAEGKTKTYRGVDSFIKSLKS